MGTQILFRLGASVVFASFVAGSRLQGFRLHSTIHEILDRQMAKKGAKQSHNLQDDSRGNTVFEIWLQGQATESKRALLAVHTELTCTHGKT